ncbi:MAG: hypothetical protein ACOY94_15625 [Bacillota bacterium]
MRTYYRLSLTVLCALAAYITPVPTLRYPYDLGYFVGGLAAALLAWALLALLMAVEPGVHPGLQLILGAGAGVTWAYTSIVALFHVLPLIIRNGWQLNDTFDPIWLLGGLSPLVVPVVAGWVTRMTGKPFGQALASALFRFSVPLAFLVLLPGWLGLPKQFRWLFLFTGVMFLVLDGLGTGGPLPLVGNGRKQRS